MSADASCVGTGDGSDVYFDDYVDDDDGDGDDEENNNDSNADDYDAGDGDGKSFRVRGGEAYWCIAGSVAMVCIYSKDVASSVAMLCTYGREHAAGADVCVGAVPEAPESWPANFARRAILFAFCTLRSFSVRPDVYFWGPELRTFCM